MTQPNFCRFLGGIGLHSYQGYENGKTNIPATLEKIIQSATGGYRASNFTRLQKGQKDFAVGLGNPLRYYTEEEFLSWQKKGKPGLPKHKPENLIKSFSSWLLVLLQAAEKKRPSNLDQVYFRMCEALNAARTDFGLEEDVDRILGKRKRAKFGIPRGQLRRNPEFARNFKFNYKQYNSDGSLAEDSEIVKVPIVNAPKWSPGPNPTPDNDI